MTMPQRSLIQLLGAVALTLFLGWPAAVAGENKPKPAGGPAGAESGKGDAAGIFAKQSGLTTAPAGSKPAFRGAYIWGGRADENYKPFFQWELRIQAGTAALSGLKMRIATLGSMKEVQSQGAWKEYGAIAAGASKDIDYRMNCPNFIAYQIEVAWSGGTETHLGWDKYAVPAPLGDLAASSMLVTVNQNFELPDKKQSATTVSWTLWNLGGQPATGVTQTIHFFDDKGKEVKAIDYTPEKGTVPANYMKEHKLTPPQVPNFATISISTKQNDTVAAAVLDQGGFSNAKDVEIAKVHAEGKVLKARIRNGTDADLENLKVTISLLDKDNKLVKKIEIPVAKIGHGAEQDLSAPLKDVPPWAGFEVGWEGGKAAPPSASVPFKPITVTVEGVVFILKQAKPAGGNLMLSGVLENHREQDLVRPVITLQLTGDGRKATATIEPDRLDKGIPQEVEIEAQGMSRVETLTMQWKVVTPGAPAKDEAPANGSAPAKISKDAPKKSAGPEHDLP